MLIKKALISVYNKTGVGDLARFLQSLDVEIISTGNTFNYLKSLNIAVKEISQVTNFPEIFGGRVKTLHPMIYGGILARRDLHQQEAKEHNIQLIDLVVVDLYPFEEFVINKKDSDQIIEQIDIGGVSLLRAAAKNYQDVCVLCDIADYKTLTSLSPSVEWRKEMAAKAFRLTSLYDKQISDWYTNEVDNWKQTAELPKKLYINETKQLNFRYGENNHQIAAFYASKLPFKQIQGKELSYNNLLDVEAAFFLATDFINTVAVIIKHNTPCAVAVDITAKKAYKKAFETDPISSFGGVIALNTQLDEETALQILPNFTEVIITPSISSKAQKVLESKKNLRILVYKPEEVAQIKHQLNIRKCFEGFLVQTPDLNTDEKFEVITGNIDDKSIKDDLLFAWKVCKHVKSNAIVIAKGLKTLGIGGGQTSRVESVKLALSKGVNYHKAVLASDAFFPFSDSIELAAKAGITAIIQPGGSLKDKEVIEAAIKHNITMIFTGVRHFKH